MRTRNPLPLVITLLLSPTVSAQTFSWDNAIVYWVMIDRFANGDPSNDHAYGRGLDPYGNAVHMESPGRFHGGDLKGLTDKVREGYFTELGVNAIWFSSPLEQVHGWVGGPDGAYPAYAYHGYWPLDFTSIDGNLGTEDDFAEFVEAAHERGIRVVMDVVINHAGYNTMADMSRLDFGRLRSDAWKTWSPGPDQNWHSYHDVLIDYSDELAWSRWWGPDWIRANLPGYSGCGTSDIDTCTSSLPDFRTESTVATEQPAFLQAKWRSAAGTNSAPQITTQTPRAHLIDWVTTWVRRYGIDGFRLDTARNLDLETIRALKNAGVGSLRAWKKANPDSRLDDLDFWMTAEIFGHGVERSGYFDAGLNSVINFALQHELTRGASIDSLYAEYSRRINSDLTFNVLSYLSSHDTHLFDRSRLRDAATQLMLLPGTVQIFYGDETGRATGPVAAIGTDATRSPMNWNNVDSTLLDHWRSLGQFRARHPAIAMGMHETISSEPYAFGRTYRLGNFEDRIIAVVGGEGRVRLNVSRLFPDNTILRDARTGKTYFVSFGLVNIDMNEDGLSLLEELD